MELQNWIWVLLTVVSLPGGLILGYIARKIWAAKQIDTAESKLQNLIQETKSKQKEMIIAAKDKAIKVIDDAKQEAEDHRKELRHLQERLENRESRFDQKLMSLEEKQQKLLEKANHLETAKREILKIKESQMEKLEKIASLTQEEAKTVLLNNTEREIKDELVQRITKLQRESSEALDRESKDILSRVIQRTAASHTAETTTTVP